MVQYETYVDATERVKIKDAVDDALERYKTKNLSGKADDFLKFKSIYIDPLTGKPTEIDFTGIGIPSSATIPETVYELYGIRFFYNLLFGDGSAKKEAEEWAQKKAMIIGQKEYEQFFGGEAGGKKGAPEGAVRPEDLKVDGKSLKDALDGMNKYMKETDGRMNGVYSELEEVKAEYIIPILLDLKNIRKYVDGKRNKEDRKGNKKVSKNKKYAMQSYFG